MQWTSAKSNPQGRHPLLLEWVKVFITASRNGHRSPWPLVDGASFHVEKHAASCRCLFHKSTCCHGELRLLLDVKVHFVLLISTLTGVEYIQESVLKPVIGILRQEFEGNGGYKGVKVLLRFKLLRHSGWLFMSM